MSCDSQRAILRLRLSVTIVVMAMNGEYWLAWLPKVCNYMYKLPIYMYSPDQ